MNDERGTLLRITSGYFVAGVVVDIVAAPIIHYMRRWSADRIITYCGQKGWIVEEL